MKQDTSRLTKMREAIQRKLQMVEESKADVEGQKETLRGQISGLERGCLLKENRVYLYKFDTFSMLFFMVVIRSHDPG